MKIIIIIIYFALLNTICFSQTNSFSKIYAPYGNDSSKPFSAHALVSNGNGYVICAIGHDNISTAYNNQELYFYGFRFGANSQLSHQGVAGVYNPYNQWINDTPINSTHYRMIDNGLTNLPFKYFYDPQYSIYDPTLAIMPIGGGSYIWPTPYQNGLSKCTENNGGQSGPDPIDNQSKREHALGKIVRGEIEYSFLEEQYRKTDNEYAYKILRNDSSIINMGGTDDNDYQQFYNNAFNSDMEKVLKMRKELEEQNLEAAKLKLMQVADDTTINTNRKIVDNIYINTWASSIFDFRQGQYDTLYAIACLEAYAGGDAVFTARVMLNIDTANVVLEYAKAPIHNPQIAKADNVKVYPNPANDRLYISLDGAIDGIANVEFYDLSGKLIYNTTINTVEKLQTLNINSIKAGVYNLRITTTNQNYNQKLVIIK
ncbi:MAG: T9SS type A sorting domain-containing protein [Bacteroidota bacterium]